MYGLLWPNRHGSSPTMHFGADIKTGEDKKKILLAELLHRCDSILETLGTTWERIEFPRFDGTRDPLQWIHRCECYFRNRWTPENKRVMYATFHLLDGAQLWYHRLPGSPPTWEQFVLLIAARFRTQITLGGGNSAGDIQDEGNKTLYVDGNNIVTIACSLDGALRAGDCDGGAYDANNVLHNPEVAGDSGIHAMDNDDDVLHKDDGGSILYMGGDVRNQGSLGGAIGATIIGDSTGKDDPEGGSDVLGVGADGNNSYGRSGIVLGTCVGPAPPFGRAKSSPHCGLDGICGGGCERSMEAVAAHAPWMGARLG
jgi:hypothetical protein